MKEVRALAFDLGASGGRAIVGTFDGSSITLQECHRFPNIPVRVNGTLYWDILRLFSEMKDGLVLANKTGRFDSIGVDTWGVDFGLLDEYGHLLENPIHYRDSRTENILEKSSKYLSPETFYNITGNEQMGINTVFQLLSLVQNRPHLLRSAKTLLFMPDLFNYMLTGIASTELSIASTSQMMDSRKKCWSYDILTTLSIPTNLLKTIVPAGTFLGKLSPDICIELSTDAVDVITVAGHDTQSALVAVPAVEDDFIFISSGTWSLVGTEINEPIINNKSAHYNITNEHGYGGKVSFLKNITGLWLLQESLRQWEKDSFQYHYDDIEKTVKDTTSIHSYIDPSNFAFSQPGNMPAYIQEYCAKTKQTIPQSHGEIILCIYESLALSYRNAIEEISLCTEKDYNNIYIVGGGSNNRILCQFTSDICNRPVVAGPSEATVLGNIIVQLISKGHIDTVATARKMLAKSSEINYYAPRKQTAWENEYLKFKEIIQC